MIHIAKKWAHLFRNLTHAVSATRYTYSGKCPHCAECTPWVTHTWSGFYQCTRCGENPLAD